MTRRTLVIFLKAPKAGRVKTRLGREIGAARAALLCRRMTELTLREARGPWRTILAIDPPSALYGWRGLWGASFERMAQAQGDLGARMRAAMRAVRAGPVVLIGADAPGLRAAHIRAAFKALGAADAVFGPATDGGYWLMGLARRRPAPRLFENVRWSSPDALADTLASLPPSFGVARLPVLRDVDEAADLCALGPLLLSAR
ncbi:MAG: TIGR04282 family arsenosugar biosynthesis glycosyltransferase [Amphiplicatus sp.]